MILGLDPVCRNLEVFRRLKAMISGLKCVVPIISDSTYLLALYGGPICKVPRAAFVDVNGSVVRPLLDTKIPTMLAGVVQVKQDGEEKLIQERGSVETGEGRINSHIGERGELGHVIVRRADEVRKRSGEGARHVGARVSILFRV